MMMASVLLAFLQLCSLQMIVVSRPTCQVQGDLIERAHNLLRDMGGAFPVHCLPYNMNISFPSSALSAPTATRSQCHQVLGVLNETLFGTWSLFEEPGVPIGEGGVTWNRDELEHFQGVWHRLIRQTRCLHHAAGSGIVNSYFSNVTAVLQQPESAQCGWMALRRDLLRFMKSALLRHRTCFTWRSDRRL